MESVNQPSENKADIARIEERLEGVRATTEVRFQMIEDRLNDLARVQQEWQTESVQRQCIIENHHKEYERKVLSALANLQTSVSKRSPVIDMLASVATMPWRLILVTIIALLAAAGVSRPAVLTRALQALENL